MRFYMKGHPVELDRWLFIITNFDRILKARATIYLGLILRNEPWQILRSLLSC